LAASRHHLAAAAYASHLLPFESMLLAMLVEEHKQVLELRRRLEEALDEGEEEQPGFADSSLAARGSLPGLAARAGRMTEQADEAPQPAAPSGPCASPADNAAALSAVGSGERSPADEGSPTGPRTSDP
jgi:hypothetical protein